MYMCQNFVIFCYFYVLFAGIQQKKKDAYSTGSFFWKYSFNLYYIMLI